MRAKKYALVFVSLAVLVWLRPDRHVEIHSTQATASGMTPIPNVAKLIPENPLHVVRIQPRLQRSDLEKAPQKPNSKLAPPPPREELCKLKSVRTSVPLKGDLRLVTVRIPRQNKSPALNEAWILSSDCPEGFYSVLRYTDDGQITDEINCRQATLTELAARTGEQGNINDVYPEGGGLNLALSGQGYFVLQCPGAELRLTRDGRFNADVFGQWTNADGCVLLSTQGLALQSADLGATGCSVGESECVATLDPDHDQVAGLEYLDDHSFRASSSLPLSRSITRVGPRTARAHLFVNALEDVRNPDRGPTGITWSTRPLINLESLNCP